MWRMFSLSDSRRQLPPTSDWLLRASTERPWLWPSAGRDVSERMMVTFLWGLGEGSVKTLSSPMEQGDIPRVLRPSGVRVRVGEACLGQGVWVRGESVECAVVMGGRRKPVTAGFCRRGNVAAGRRGGVWLVSSSTCGMAVWTPRLLHLIQARGECRVILVESTELREALSGKSVNPREPGR